MKDRYVVKEYDLAKFLQALKLGALNSKQMYEKAKEIDGKVCTSPISHEDIIAIKRHNYEDFH